MGNVQMRLAASSILRGQMAEHQALTDSRTSPGVHVTKDVPGGVANSVKPSNHASVLALNPGRIIRHEPTACAQVGQG